MVGLQGNGNEQKARNQQAEVTQLNVSLNADNRRSTRKRTTATNRRQRRGASLWGFLLVSGSSYALGGLMRLDSVNYRNGGGSEFPYRVVACKLSPVTGGGQISLQYSDGFVTLQGATTRAERLSADPDWDDVRIYEYRGYVPVAFFD